MNITAIFCDVDDFCKIFIPAWQRLLLPEEVPRAFVSAPYVELRLKLSA